MLIAFLIYLINVFESIQKLACIFLIIGVCLIGVAFLFSVVTNSLDNEIDKKVAKKVAKKVIKFSSIFFIVLSLIVVFVPKSETMYLMIGAYVGSKVIQNPEVNENLSKVYKIINYKLDEVLDEYEQNLKENTSKALSR